MTLIQLWYIGMMLVVVVQQGLIFYLFYKYDKKKDKYIIKIINNNQK